MRITAILVFIFVFLVGFPAGAEIIFEMKDPAGDDRGGGSLQYPAHDVFVPGLFDLRKFTVSMDEETVFFDFQFAEITNPFGAPEGYFHQRMEVYIDTSFPGGNEEIIIGEHRLQSRPQFGWEARLSVAPFNEVRLFFWNPVKIRQFGIDDGLYSRLEEDGKTIRAAVPRSLLPEADRAWRYYVLTGAFDGLGAGLWRHAGDDPLWQAGGEGVPVFDLLAPRLGLHTQKAQLAKGVLWPVGGPISRVPRLVVILLILFGMVLLSVMFFWRR